MTHRHSQSQPRQNEDEYFARQDAELIKQMRARLDEDRRTQERKAHFMKCPKCGADLQEQSVEHSKIDVCPECHGMWLDAGELDLLHHVGKSKGPRYSFLDGLMGFFPHRSAARK
jgi:uncharacterized protein